MKQLTPLVTILIIAALGGMPAPCAADVVLDWNEVALTQVVAAQQAPPDGARSLALVPVAMFDAPARFRLALADCPPGAR